MTGDERPAVVFDLDGTLIDTAPDIVGAARVLLKSIGAPALSASLVKSFIGDGVPKLVERVVTASGLRAGDHGELVAKYLTIYSAALASESRVYPNVVATLDALRAAGFVLGVCTNKTEAPSRLILAAYGLDGFFDVIVGGDSLASKKPDPEMLHHVFDALSGRRALYVGDSEVDSETAVRAGVRFALFSEGYRKSKITDLPHDFVFNDFPDLPGIVRQAGEVIA
ncbi:MAG: phosphoglycolate phosphatase [Paracoccaceae bacterium]